MRDQIIIRSWNSVFCTHEKNILTLIFHGPHLDNGIYTKAKKVSLLREREVYPNLFREAMKKPVPFLYDCDDAKSTA